MVSVLTQIVIKKLLECSDCDKKVIGILENRESKLRGLRYEHEKLLEEFIEWKAKSQCKWVNSAEMGLSRMVRQFEDAIIQKWEEKPF